MDFDQKLFQENAEFEDIQLVMESNYDVLEAEILIPDMDSIDESGLLFESEDTSDYEEYVANHTPDVPVEECVSIDFEFDLLSENA